MSLSPLAGQPASQQPPIDLNKLIATYYDQKPDPAIAAQKVIFGTSGHRGSSLDCSFNEDHILAITQAICDYRQQQGINGPLYIGIDTHALSEPAYRSALEVLAANAVETMIAADGEYTPTPVISHAILIYNKGRKDGLADGIVITPSHNPPRDGGFKYNPPNGGPSSTEVSNIIQAQANEYLKAKLSGVKRITYEQAAKAATTHSYDYKPNYISDLASIVNMEAIRSSGLRLGADPLGGAGVHYWQPIAEQYRLDMTIVNAQVDKTFKFMTLDWDGQIRMDPSSPYAMRSLIGMKDKFDISFACDTDHDRHGIVTRSTGLLPPNHYLAVMIQYLIMHRPHWNASAAISKTLVSSQMIDRVVKKLGRKLYEVPVGFKWFVDGLYDGSLCFGGEESAGAIFSRMNGEVWTTDKDGMVPALLSAEIMAVTGKDPGEIYNDLTKEFGESHYTRIEAAASTEQKSKLSKLSPSAITTKDLAGEKITQILSNAPGNNAPIGGIKIESESGWFAARPSGTEDIYKIYGESFKSEAHLKQILDEAQTIVTAAIK
ncbi:MAG: alpha-D-glucose phosphate-specific phosphoglucomutase [Bacteroidetes bacterium]|nr:alpha-D-glucose phosphate-specific phosphoglucomutase [Bacteroidota bacterium]